MNLMDALTWRYATKRMNGKTVPENKIQRIVEAAQLAPSSYGLQPYSLISISNREVLQRIYQTAAPQPQILECSHLLVFAAWQNVDQSKIDEFIQLNAELRELSMASLQDYKASIEGLIKGMETPDAQLSWAAKQAYIALGFALIAAASEKVDATPMEGFYPAELDAILGLQEKQLRSAVIVALGYRNHETDWLAKLPKVRWPASKFLTNIA